MSISSSGARKSGPFTGDGNTAVFPFTFKVFQASDLLVVQTDTTPTDHTLVLNTDYTVTLNANQDANPGGAVNMPVAPPSGYLLTLGSNVPELQSVTLTNNGGFYPTVINSALDYLTILIQQVSEKVGRALVMPFSSNASGELPPVAPGQLLGWKADGSGIDNVGASGVGAGSIVASNMAAGATGTALSNDTQAASTKSTPADADLVPIFDSASIFSLKNLTWANLKATLGDLLNMTGAVNFARTTLASAATIDPWTGAGNTVDVSGTVTVTGIAAAPQAGATRRLRATGAFSITTSANIIIDGYASGQTLTLAAGDRLELEAVTITQFVLHLIKADGTPVRAFPGVPLMWPMPSPPSWAVVRDGSALSRSVYAKLFSVLCPTMDGTTTASGNAVTGLSSTASMKVGMEIEGTGIPGGTTIASITSATSITMSNNATASGSVPITLFYYGYGAAGGSTTFGVPDDRGVFERGLDTGAAALDTLTYACANTSGSPTIAGLSSTAGMSVGMALSGTGVPGGATILSIDSATQITISANSTSAVSALTVQGNRVGAYGADQFGSHSHSAIHSGGNANYGYGTTGIFVLGGGATGATGNTETKPKNRAYLPIIVY